MRHLPAWCRPLLLAAALLCPQAITPPAAAQTTENLAKDASRHFQRGVDLYNEGDFRGALAEFRKAYRLIPRASVLYNIGQTEYQVQEYAQALRTLERFLAETGAGVPHRAEVQETVETLRTRVGWIALTSNRADCDVTVDDQPAGTTPLGRSLLVSIGRRKIVLGCAGQRVTRDVEVASGETIRLDLKVEPAPVVAMSEAGPGGAEKPRSGRRLIFTSLAITGLLGAGTLGLYTTAIVGSRQLDRLRGTYPVSPERLEARASSNRRLAIAGDVRAVATVAAAGLTTYLSLRARKRDEGGRAVALGLSPDGLTVRGNF
jgi:hypothetical protein